MTPMWKTRAGWALILALTALPACVAAAAAGAGAATGIYLTTRGAASTVPAPVNEVAARARSVFRAEGVELDAASVEDRGDSREIKGKKGDLDITVSMERESETTTKTEVTARKNVAEWDKDYAKHLLDRIVRGTAS